MLKRALFRFFALLPLVLLIGAFTFVFFDARRASNRDHKALCAQLARSLETKRATWFSLPKDFNKGTAADVYVFGESSLLLSDGENFPQLLQKKLSREFPRMRIVNLGYSGIDSLSILARVLQSLDSAKKPPAAIILYYGHNDYDNAYNEYLLPIIGMKTPDILLDARYTLTNQGAKRKYCPEAACDRVYYLRTKRPAFIRLFQRVGLLRIRAADYACYNRMILNYFKKNTESIIRNVTSRKIPVIIVTPIGNLHAEPCGDLHVTDKLFRLGLREKDYGKAFEYLSKARDSETCSYDVRAKSDLTRYIRNIHHDGVRVVDLEGILMRRKFKFDNSEFMDYFHMNASTHYIVASVLADAIVRDPEIRRRIEETR